YAGIHCGVRPGRDSSDLALLVSDLPASAAGVFTQNRVRAAPVRVCQERLPRGDARGIVICSGNANACTGQRGLDDAGRMTVVSDAPVSAEDLHGVARRATAQSFNCVRVEGHTSTNDSLILLANGQGKKLDNDGLARFGSAATEVCAELARAIAADAEGASHLITIDVEGLRDDREAAVVARAVADSALVKTAVFGADPNWGRIVSAAGY